VGPDPVAAAEPEPAPPARRGWRALVIDVGPLRRHREFRLLWFGYGVTYLGSMITYVAVPYQVFAITHSSAAVGLLGLVEFAALMSMAFVGGALADAVDRRWMIRVTEAVLALVSVGLVVNALLPRPSLAVLFVAAGLTIGIDSLQRPSLEAMLPRLVPREELTAAGALSTVRQVVGMIAGPALAGVLIAVVGLPATYGVDVATFAVSLAVLAMMRAVPPPPDASRPSLRSVAQGLRYARSRPELLGTYLVDFNAMFFGMPNALFPALAAHYGGARVLGLLYAAPAVGSFVATVTSGWTARIDRHGLAVLWAAGLWGVAVIGFGLAPWLWAALLALVAAGAADMVSGLFRMVIWNSTIPDTLRGRLAGIELVSYASGPMLGNVEAGAVAAATGPRLSVDIGGIACVAGTLALAVALPAFRRYDRRQESGHERRTTF
jgi:MFS family permease